MKINWFTFIAQIVNFLLLVWLLRRFLYRPILKAVDEREKKIAEQLKDAKDEKADTEKEKDEFKKKNEKFDKQKKELMDKAVAEAKKERQTLFEDARKDAKKLSEKLEETSKTALENLNQEIAQKTQQEVFAITRKTLADLASVSLEEQSVNIFIKQLNNLKTDDKKKFMEAFNSESKSVLVRSAFDLPHKQQTEIKDSVKDILDAKPHFQFSTVPELVSGIELTANGYKLAWNISEYLSSLEKGVAEILKEKAKPEPENKTETKEKDKEEGDKESDENSKSENK
jgi:F-type H+-transporting ATPase subunit b